MDSTKPLERRTWFVSIVCVLGLAMSWASFWVVYAALPNETRAAHWGLEVLVLAATGGFLLINERLLASLFQRLFPRLQPDRTQRRGRSDAPSTSQPVRAGDGPASVGQGR